uniref:Uncharacterized protein n=1 Tax=Zea mays TaxID=4577 RepID=A0A804QB24_MAIZE
MIMFQICCWFINLYYLLGLEGGSLPPLRSVIRQSQPPVLLFYDLSRPILRHHSLVFYRRFPANPTARLPVSAPPHTQWAPWTLRSPRRLSGSPPEPAPARARAPPPPLPRGRPASSSRPAANSPPPPPPASGPSRRPCPHPPRGLVRLRRAQGDLLRGRGGGSACPLRVSLAAPFTIASSCLTALSNVVVRVELRRVAVDWVEAPVLPSVTAEDQPAALGVAGRACAALAATLAAPLGALL